MPSPTFQNGTEHPVVARVSHPERFSTAEMNAARLAERIGYVDTSYIDSAAEEFVRHGQRISYLNTGNVQQAGAQYRLMMKETFGVTFDEGMSNLTLGRMAIALNRRAATRLVDYQNAYERHVANRSQVNSTTQRQVREANVAIERQREAMTEYEAARDHVTAWMNTPQDETENRFKAFRRMIESLSSMPLDVEVPATVPAPEPMPETTGGLTSATAPRIEMEHPDQVPNRQRATILAGVGLIRDETHPNRYVSTDAATAPVADDMANPDDHVDYGIPS